MARLVRQKVFAEEQPLKPVKELDKTDQVSRHIVFKDKQFLKDLWPTISRAMEFVLSGQTKDGDILWAKDENNYWMDDSLLTGCSSIYKSLLCFQKISFELGFSELFKYC